MVGVVAAMGLEVPVEVAVAATEKERVLMEITEPIILAVVVVRLGTACRFRLVGQAVPASSSLDIQQ